MTTKKNGEVVSLGDKVTVLLKEDGKLVFSIPAQSLDEANSIVDNWEKGSYGLLTE